jgi:hypothetical protein
MAAIGDPRLAARMFEWAWEMVCRRDSHRSRLRRTGAAQQGGSRTFLAETVVLSAALHNGVA